MLLELTTVLLLSIRCDQACLDSGFDGGTAKAKDCRCYHDISQKVMLGKLERVPDVKEVKTSPQQPDDRTWFKYEEESGDGSDDDRVW